MSRWRYFFKRLLLSVPVLFLVMTVIFVVLRMGPLDPVAAMLGPEGAGGADAQAIRRSLGLDQPLWQQYIDFIRDLITFNLGQSWVLHPNRKVTTLLTLFGPRTLWLGFWAILLPLFIGIPLGFYAGLNPNSWGDYVASFGGIVWLAMPNFWLAIMLLTVLRRTDGGGWFGFDWYTIGPNTESLIGSPSLDFIDVSWIDLGVVSVPSVGSFEWITFVTAIKVILPAAIVLGSASMASELRIGRTAVLETINSNYVETAKAKGLSNRVIVWKHVFRNALIPLLPIITNEAFLLIGGSVIVEQVFNINGIGKLFFQAAVQGDLPLAGSLIYIFTLIIIFLNIVQDLLYTILDPRVGYDQ